MIAEDTLTIEQTECLADYLVLARFDTLRGLAYGDMANARRGRELQRLADALIESGVRIRFDPEARGPFVGYGFPEVDGNAIRRAFDRVGAPRAVRAIDEALAQRPRPSKYKLATIETWRRVAAEVQSA